MAALAAAGLTSQQFAAAFSSMPSMTATFSHSSTQPSTAQLPQDDSAAADSSEVPQPVPPRRRPRYAYLKKDDTGLPIEAVYAPRKSQYLTKARLAGRSGGNRALNKQGFDREEGLNNAQRLRILGGTAKGRRLESPEVCVELIVI